MSVVHTELTTSRASGCSASQVTVGADSVMPALGLGGAGAVMVHLQVVGDRLAVGS
ncbi:MAG: hypothetical protein ACRDS1_06220 [Pseudonocardiaceae bacterium]